MATTNERLQAEYERRRAEEGRTDHGTMTYGAGEKQMFVTGETYQNPIVQQGLKRMGAVLYDTNLPDERWSVVPRNITYWESPQRIARYYHAFRTLPPGSQPPPWANREAIDFAYRQLAAANKGQPWYTWGPLTADDPLRDVMRSMPVPPPEAMPKWEQDYYQKLFERKQKDQSRELDRDSIYRALYMQRPNVKPDGTVLWAGSEPDPEKRKQFSQDAWSGLAQLSQFEALQRGQTAQPKAEGIPTYGEWLQMVIDQVPSKELEGLDGEALMAIYRIQTGQAQPGDYEPLVEMPDLNWLGIDPSEWEQMPLNIKALNALQKIAPWAVPIGTGALIAKGVGGWVGPVLGATFAGAAYYSQANPDTPFAKIFSILNKPFEEIEQAWGYTVQKGYAEKYPEMFGFDPSDPEQRRAADLAGNIFYETRDPGVMFIHGTTRYDEQGRPYIEQYVYGKAEPVRQYMEQPVELRRQIEELAAEYEKEFASEKRQLGWEYIKQKTGATNYTQYAAMSLDPDSNYGSAYAMLEMRNNILAGMAPEQALALSKQKLGLIGDANDLAAGFMLDPLDLAAPAMPKIAAGVAAVKGNKYAAAAFGKAPDLVTGSKLYGQMIRQMPPAEAAAFDSVSRWLAGVDETGNLRQYANTKQKFLSFDWAFGLTPAARAREFMNVAENNLAALLADETNPEQMVRFLDAVADMHPGDAVRAAQKSITIKVGGEDVTVELPRTMQAAEAQPIPLALRDLKGKWHDLLDQWNITRPHAALIAQIAAETGTNPAKLIDDLHNQRVNGDAVLRQYADGLDARAKAGDEAAAKMLELMKKDKGRGLTGRQLKAIADNFSGSNGAALTIGQFRGQLDLLLQEGLGQWAARYWNVKTPPWLIRMSNLIKKAQSAPLLGGNPNYLANNFFTDTATMAWDGLLGFSSAADEAAFIKRLGFVPTRLREGHGMIGDTGPTAKDPIGQALRGDDALQAMDDLLGSTRKFQPFVVLTSKLEGLHSRQAVFAGMREYLNWFNHPGVGFDHMPDGLRGALEQVRPGLADKIEHAIAGGATKAEIEAMVFTGKERLSVRDVLDREELVMLDKFPGLVDQLDADLAKATTPTETRAAFAKAKETFITRLNEQIAQKMSRTVGDAMIKAKVEGTQGVLDMLDGMMADRTTFWLEHMRKMDEAADIASTLSEGERALHWQRVQTEADRAWTAFENIEGAKWLGVFEALGAGQMTDDGIKVMRLMTDQHDNWSAFYTTRRQLFDEYNNNIATLPPAKSRTPDQQLQAKAWWDETNQKLNTDYVDAVLEEDRLQTQFDDLFAEQYGKQFAGESGRFAGGAQTWRGAIRDSRRKMAAAMTVYRTGSYPQAMLDAWGEVLTGEQMAYLQQINKGQPIYQMMPADRAQAQKRFYQKVYHKLIGNQLEASHANMPGGRKPAQEPAPEADLTRVNQGDSAGSDVAPATDMVAGENARPGASGEVERRVSTAEERAVWAATHDPMTRLKNRLAFEGDPNNPDMFAGDWNLRLQAAAEAGDPPPVVAVADLRGLHATNTISYEVGNEYIRTMAQAFADEGLEAYRIGGDEFAVIFADEATAQTAMEAVTKRLENAIIKTPEGEYYGGKAHFGIGSDLTTAADAQTRAKLADPRADEFTRASYSLSRRDADIPAAEGVEVRADEGSGTPADTTPEADRVGGGGEEGGPGTAETEDLTPRARLRIPESRRAPTTPRDRYVELGILDDNPKLQAELNEFAGHLASELEPSRSTSIAYKDVESGVEVTKYKRVWEDAPIWYQGLYRAGYDKATVRRVLRKIKRGDTRPSKSQYVQAAETDVRAALIDEAVRWQPRLMLELEMWDELGEWWSQNGTRADDLGVDVDAYWAQEFGSREAYSRVVDIWLDWIERKDAEWKQFEEFGYDGVKAMDDVYVAAIHEATGRIVTPNEAMWLYLEGNGNSARKLANEYGVATATADGRPNDRHLLNILNQYGYKVDSLDLVDLDMVRDVLERRKLALEAAQPQLQAELDRRIVMHRAETMKRNQEALQLTSYRKPTRDLAVREVYDHYANKFPNDPGKAKAMAEATMVIWDAWARKYADDYGVSPDDFYSTFIVERGGVGSGVNLNQEGLAQASPAVGPKGFTRWMDDATGLIHAFEKADVSTFAHEIVHIYTPLFKGDDLKIINGWLAKEYGIKDLPDGWHVGAEQHQFTTVNGVKMGEKDLLARAYERYLAEGWAPNRKLRAVFDNIKRWMMEIYRSITGSEIDIKISDELRGLFDRIHGDEEFMASLRAEPEPVAPAPVAESLWGKPQQMGMFEAEDTPLFSGTPMRAQEQVFAPEAVGDQGSLFNRGEYLPAIEGKKTGADYRALIDDLTDAVVKNNRLHSEAIRAGKRSQAKVNVDRIAQKYGVPREVVDVAAGRGIMGSLENDPAAVRSVITDHIETWANQQTAEAGPLFEQTATKSLITFTADDVPYDLAQKAHRGTSFVPERRAESTRREYVQHIQSVIDTFSPLADTPEKMDVLRTGLERYKEGYLKHLLAYLSARTKLVSSMIAGPSKFPVARMQKVSKTVDNRLAELVAFSRKAQHALRNQLDPRPPRGISADRPDAVIQLENKLARAEQLQTLMVEANKIVRKKGIEEAEKIQQLIALGLSEKHARELFKPDFAGRIGFPDYAVKNNNAEIRRLKGRIQEVSTLKATPEGEWTFEGGRIVENAEANRLQIFFDDKPEAAIRDQLKRNGFKWAPSQGAWQRQRNANALAAVERLFPDMQKVEVEAPIDVVDTGDFIEPKITVEDETQPASDTLFQTAPPTHTEEFRRWFGESKVVDDNGQPLWVYHGTAADFEAFDPKMIGKLDTGWWGKGFYFAKEPFHSQVYAESAVDRRLGNGAVIMPVYLRMEKPFYLHFDKPVPEEVLKVLTQEDEWAIMVDKGKAPAELDQFDFFNGLVESERLDDNGSQRLTEILQQAGYDGVVVGNGEYVVFSPEQIKSVFNRGTFDPNDPRILYQENPVTDAAVGAPLGTGDHYMDMPLDEAMLMGWMQHLEPALEGAERKLTGEGAFRPTLGEAESVVSPEMKRELRRYIGQTQMQLKDVNLGALRWGESRRDMALLNYNRRTHFDNFLGGIFPYQFWYTRTALNWALRTLSRPGIMADYLRLANFGQDQQDQPGYPTRLRGKVGIPMPFLPDWMGDGVYIDPMRMIYPFHQMTVPWKMWTEQRNREQKQAEYLVQDWMEAQEIDADEGTQAIESMTGPVWERALAQVRAEDNVGATNPMGIGSDREIRNPIDMVFNFMGPSLPISIGYDVLTGRKEHISQLPVTRLIQNTTALLGIGGERGINIEGPIRRAVGLPEIDRFEDYRIDRELASMVADGLIDHQTAIVAMIERSGEAFTEAQRRVTQVMGTRFFTSSLGLDFFPEGEQEMRLLKEEYDRAWQAYDAGDTEAVTAFWDEHPEYEARRAQFTEDPEARLRMFLQRQIWDQYREMNPAEKRATRERFGEVFEDAFLNKETRSYNSIPVEVMAAWAQAIGGRVPETELAGDAGTTPATGTDSLELPGVDDYYSEREKQFPGIQELWDLEETLGNEQKRRLRKQYPMLDEYSVWRNRYLADHPETIQYVISEDDDLYGLPQDIQGAVFEFRAQRDELFPGVFDVQDHYFAIQGKDEKRAYLAKHPELKRYWSWRRQYAAANVKIAPYILGEESLAQYILGDEGKTLTHPPFLSDAEFEQLPPELLRALAAHIYAGRPLGKGALAEVEAMRRELAPGLDIDSFIEMYLKAAVEQ